MGTKETWYDREGRVDNVVIITQYLPIFTKMFVKISQYIHISNKFYPFYTKKIKIYQIFSQLLTSFDLYHIKLFPTLSNLVHVFLPIFCLKNGE